MALRRNIKREGEKKWPREWPRRPPTSHPRRLIRTCDGATAPLTAKACARRQRQTQTHHRSNNRLFNPSFDVCHKKATFPLTQNSKKIFHTAFKASGLCCSDTSSAIIPDGSCGVVLSINSSSSLNRCLLSPPRLLNRRTH